MKTERVYKLFPLLVAMVTLAGFAATLGNDFVDWDDRVNFVLNPHYRGLGWEQIRWMWTSALMAHYIPVSWMTLGLDYTLWGMEPWGYHLTSVLFHAANAVLFYYLALALLRLAISVDSPSRRSIPAGALFAALVFAIHPLRVESVGWITERRDEVSGLFYLLSLLAYLRACRNGAGPLARRKEYWLSLACFTLAILSKEIAVTLPLVLLVLDYYPLRRLGGGVRSWLWAGLEKVPFLVLGLADSAYAVYLGRQEGLASSLGAQGWMTRIAVAVYNLAFYLWKTLTPVHLAPFYPLTAHRVDPGALPFQASLAVVLFIAAAAFLFRRRYPAILAASLAYVAALFPVLGIVNTFKQIVADRYSYLACMSWEILAGAGFLMLWTALPGRRSRIVAGTTGALVVVALGALTIRQTGVWKDAESLWTYTTAIEPSFIASNGMGLAVAERGDYAGAIPHFRDAIAMDPDYELAHHNLGVALLNLGNAEDAAREFETALRLKPDLGASQTSWGVALLMQGKAVGAIPHFERALQLNPDDDSARRNLDRARALTAGTSGR